MFAVLELATYVSLFDCREAVVERFLLLFQHLLTTRPSADGLGYLKILAPPEKVLRWIEGKLNLLGRLPHYVSIDQKTYGRYGVLPTTNAPRSPSMPGAGEGSVPMTYMGSTERLGP